MRNFHYGKRANTKKNTTKIEQARRNRVNGEGRGRSTVRLPRKVGMPVYRERGGVSPRTPGGGRRAGAGPRPWPTPPAPCPRAAAATVPEEGGKPPPPGREAARQAARQAGTNPGSSAAHRVHGAQFFGDRCKWAVRQPWSRMKKRGESGQQKKCNQFSSRKLSGRVFFCLLLLQSSSAGDAVVC